MSSHPVRMRACPACPIGYLRVTQSTRQTIAGVPGVKRTLICSHCGFRRTTHEVTVEDLHLAVLRRDHPELQERTA